MPHIRLCCSGACISSVFAAILTLFSSCAAKPAAVPLDLPLPAAVQPAAVAAAASSPAQSSTPSENLSPTRTGPDVRIMLIHFRGTLARIGCCNPALYERDEFVVIQNVGDMPQYINNWSLTNITRGYPTFYFPSYYPCLPYNAVPLDETEVTDSYYTAVSSPAQSESGLFTKDATTTKPTNIPPGEVEWGCGSTAPLDQVPMKPGKGQQGIPQPCVLNPGQTILVFTDEVHCTSGGLSFNWGLGNIWNNEIPDTAVLYDDKGKEISRRSYTAGR